MCGEKGEGIMIELKKVSDLDEVDIFSIAESLGYSFRMKIDGENIKIILEKDMKEEGL